MADTPRKTACLILSYLERGKGRIDPLVQSQTKGWDKRDRAFVYELVYGVTRNKRALDFIIGNNSRRPVSHIHYMVLMLLRIGVYQSYAMDKIPAYAAVNEAVNQAKYFNNAMTSAVAYINAVLRSVIRNTPPESHYINGLAGAVESYMDDSIEPEKKLGIVHSYPKWLVSHWVNIYGLKGAESLMKNLNKRAPVFFRVNVDKLGGGSLEEKLYDEGIAAEQVDWADDLYKVTKGAISPEKRLFCDGFIQPQDGASYMAASLLDPKPGETVADICCGKGIKSGQFARLMNNEGTIISADNNKASLEKFNENMERQQVSIAHSVAFDATTQWPIERKFSKIFVDAPCSNYGVIRRHPEGKWNKSPELLKKIQKMQHKILKKATGKLEPGGSLVYAVCTMDKKECLDVVEKSLAKNLNLKRVDIKAERPELAQFVSDNGDIDILPGQGGMDGFYAAKLEMG